MRNARHYAPATPFNVAMKLLVPTTTIAYGVPKKTYPDPDSIENVFFGSFRTFGGTENLTNDVYTIIDTAIIDTWYRPDIKADCQVYVCETDQTYDIISDPEDINMRHQYLQFQVRKVGGSA